MGEGASRMRMRYVGPLFEDGPLVRVESGFMQGIELGPLGIGAIDARAEATSGLCGESAPLVLGPRL